MESTWKERKNKLDPLKNGQRHYSPELKAYLLSVTDKLCACGFSLEECADILGMWSGTLIRWQKNRET